MKTRTASKLTKLYRRYPLSIISLKYFRDDLPSCTSSGCILQLCKVSTVFVHSVSRQFGQAIPIFPKTVLQCTIVLSSQEWESCAKFKENLRTQVWEGRQLIHLLINLFSLLHFKHVFTMYSCSNFALQYWIDSMSLVFMWCNDYIEYNNQTFKAITNRFNSSKLL